MVLHHNLKGLNMKLCYSPTSPYVRKVMVVAIETGLDGQIEKLTKNVWAPDTDTVNFNPLGKVPALILDNGTTLFDSPVICEYLDSIGNGGFFPKEGEARWNALRLQALADGVMDAAILRLLEGKRDEGTRSENWITRQKSVMERGLDALENDLDRLGGDLTIGGITVGVMLSYLDFRYVADNWRTSRPGLADWYDGIADRPSVVATEPKDPT